MSDLSTAYNQELLSSAVNGDLDAIACLAMQDNDDMWFLNEVLPQLRHLELDVIREVISKIPDSNKVDSLMFDLDLESAGRIENERRRSAKYRHESSSLMKQTWYRGIYARSIEDITDPLRNTRDPQYGVFITNCPIQAYTYSRGAFIATIKLKEGFVHRLLETVNGRFSQVKFDDAVRGVFGAYTGVVAQDVRDGASFANTLAETFGEEVIRQVYHQAINIGLNGSTDALELVALEPAKLVVDRYLAERAEMNGQKSAISVIPKFEPTPAVSPKAKSMLPS